MVCLSKETVATFQTAVVENCRQKEKAGGGTFGWTDAQGSHIPPDEARNRVPRRRLPGPRERLEREEMPLAPREHSGLPCTTRVLPVVMLL